MSIFKYKINCCKLAHSVFSRP